MLERELRRAGPAPHPVNFAVDPSQAADLKPWAELAARAWEQAYPMICDELAIPGYQPPRVIPIKIEKDYDGVAGFSSTGIAISAKFHENPKDSVAAVIHETPPCRARLRKPASAHVAGRRNRRLHSILPLVAGRVGPRHPDHAHYNGSYRITASFLNFLVDRYDPSIVRKLNRLNREGKYRDSAFQEITAKSIETLGAEWHATLPRTPADFAPRAQTDDKDPAGHLLWRHWRAASLAVP